MCNAHNHPPDCTCGWGGDGHLGGGGGGVSYTDRLLIAYEYEHGEARPSYCSYCGQEVYVYTNDYGSFVVFDELGHPWPKHECYHRYNDWLSWYSIDRYITDSVNWLFSDCSQEVRGPVDNIKRVTARPTLKRLPAKQTFRLEEWLALLLSRLNRDDLVFPCQCDVCGEQVTVLFPRSKAPVTLSDVWSGKQHRCEYALPLMFYRELCYRDFAWGMTGLKDVAGRGMAAAEENGQAQGLIVEIRGSSLTLLTSAGLLRNVPCLYPVKPLDYVRISWEAKTTKSLEKFVLLRGKGDGSSVVVQGYRVAIRTLG